MMNRNKFAEHIMRAGVFCCLTAVLAPVHAEDLPDPTRPPASIFVHAAGMGVARRTKSSVGLHSIIISQKRRAAIIDGKTVELGEMHGNAKLVEVNAGSVVLQRGKSRQVLTLFPGVKITRMEMPGKESAKMESSSNEAQVEQPSSASKVESDKLESTPAEHDEKQLTGHPKEEK